MLKFLVVLALATVALGAPQPKHLVPMLDGRIVGGSTANIANYPYQISLLFANSHICGGSIISATWVLTAAHCTTTSVNSFSVRYGSSIRNSGGQTRAVSRIINHPSYSSFTIDYDFALIQLHSAIVASTTTPAAIIRLPVANAGVTSGLATTITGWGTTTSGGSAANQLKVVQVPVISQAQCRSAYGTAAITDRMFCAGLLGVGGKDACQGDSGGPAIVNGVLAGVVSWGYGCADPRYPGVYASVSSVRAWITQNANV